MQAVKRANELPPEHFEAMQAAPFLTAKVEVEGAPLGVRVPGPVPHGVEIRFPFGPAISRANRVRQRPVKGVALSDSEQLNGGGVDEVRKLLDLIVQKAIAKVQVKPALDG